MSRLGQGQEKTSGDGARYKLLATRDRTERSDGQTQPDDEEKCRWPGEEGKGDKAKVKTAGGMQVRERPSSGRCCVLSFLPVCSYPRLAGLKKVRSAGVSGTNGYLGG